MGKVKFAVFTDFHYDITPDGQERLECFIKKARKADVDFIIELGDFCIPNDKNKDILSLFNGFEKPHYHVIGNHDTDIYSKSEHMNWLGMDKSYYSFIHGNVKFIVIDSSFIQYGNEFETYYRQNYNEMEGLYPVIPNEELHWLEQEISASLFPIIIFSHHSLENNFRKRGISNRTKVQNIINCAELNGKKVLLCVNGHDHADSMDKVHNTYYFTLNSMTYKWFGSEFEHFCYSDEIHKQYPYLKDIILYEEALSAIISIDEDYNIDIQGMKSNYQNITPNQLGITSATWDGRIISPCVSSFTIKNK